MTLLASVEEHLAGAMGAQIKGQAVPLALCEDTAELLAQPGEAPGKRFVPPPGQSRWIYGFWPAKEDERRGAVLRCRNSLPKACVIGWMPLASVAPEESASSYGDWARAATRAGPTTRTASWSV